MKDKGRKIRVGFVSTRIAGTDGVSLEIGKWADVVPELGNGFECFYICGESDRAADRTVLIEEAHFRHPEIQEITRQAFASESRSHQLTTAILDMSAVLLRKLNDAIRTLELDAVIAENALTIPMNIPLGLALVFRLQQGNLACLAHHHDFYWERSRFLVSSVRDLLNLAFPPPLPYIEHVVINSVAGEEFSRRTGMSCRIVPNVMDFDQPPPPPDDHCRGFRSAVGVAEDDILILQPTRVVARKGIEHTLELARRLDPKRARVVITHASGDEGDEYRESLIEFADVLGVSLVFADHLIRDARGEVPEVGRTFTIHDAYQNADIVSYPSEYEGFGNAFLEAVYYRRPIVCNRYSIYRTDIEPLGFRDIVFDGFMTRRTIDEVERVLQDDDWREETVEHNYDTARRFFSYEVLRKELNVILTRPQNVYRSVGKGVLGRL